MTLLSVVPTLAWGDDQLAVIAFFGTGLILGVVSIVSRAIVRISQVRMRETSRREIAAYVAEGSISPDVAEKLLAERFAGREKPGRCC